MALAIDTTSYRSKNYNERPKGEISAIVFHDGEGTKKGDLDTLCDNTVPEDDRVSAHYYVDRLGHIYQLVDDSKRAWHAGASSLLGRTNWNDFSIGVESEHKKGQNWPQVQVQALHDLFTMLVAKYGIQEQYIRGHKEIAVPAGRKPDPTDWPTPELRIWIHGLYVKLSYEIPGLTTSMACGKGFYDFYNTNGGLGMFGYALTPEALAIDTLSRACTWMRLERAVFKYVEGEGVHLALLVEASVKKWLT